MSKTLREPKTIIIRDKKVVVSKFPAMDGLEIMTQLPIAVALSPIKLLDFYKKNEALVYKLLSYVGVDVGAENPIALETKELIDGHLVDWEIVAITIKEMVEYNCSNFLLGRVSTFCEDIARQVPTWISSTFTQSLEQLSQKAKQHLQN